MAHTAGRSWTPVPWPAICTTLSNMQMKQLQSIELDLEQLLLLHLSFGLAFFRVCVHWGHGRHGKQQVLQPSKLERSYTPKRTDVIRKLEL